jgi:hypothetical protein
MAGVARSTLARCSRANSPMARASNGLSWKITAAPASSGAQTVTV